MNSIIKIDKNLLDKVAKSAAQSERRRINYNFHSEFSDPINRMLNALELDTYCRPHKHENPDKREVFILLRGKIVLVVFDDKGKVTDHVLLSHESQNLGIEVLPRTWHSVFSLEEGSIVYEIKDGPYTPLDDKSFASWAPNEKSPESDTYLRNLKKELGF